MNARQDRVSMHGVRRPLLEAQANSIGLPLLTLEMPEQPSMAVYESIMQEKITTLKEQGFSQAIFGDIFLEDLRKYREEKLALAGIEAIFPLWKMDTKELVHQFLFLGFKTIVVCVNDQYLDESFCGRVVDEQFLLDLPGGVDPCGENGEFHTFVFDGPIFKEPVLFETGELVYKQYEAPTIASNSCSGMPEPTQEKYGYWFCDLV
jgi:uncharacterized protein (TIGR00290 family)